MTDRLRRAALYPVLLLALILTGCDSDSLGGDSVFLTFEVNEDVTGEDIIYSFDTSEVETGRLVDLSCDCTLDVEEFLSTQGFTKNELVSARLESAQIVMLFPTSEQVDFLNEAILKLSAPGLSPTEIANASSFPAARQVEMQVLGTRDIASFLDSPGFSAILQIDPAELVPDEEYELSIIMTVRMELEGV